VCASERTVGWEGRLILLKGQEMKDSYDRYKDDLNTMLAGFAGRQNSVVIPRVFVEFFGSLEMALFFNQCLYWSDRAQIADRWFYKTYEEWREELGLSEYQIRKSARALSEYIETIVRKAQGNPTVHYRVKWDTFSVSFLEFLKERNQRNLSIEPLETSVSLKTEITPEITSNITIQEGAIDKRQLPDWYIILASIPGFKRSVMDCLTWVSEKDYTRDELEQTAYDLKGKWNSKKMFDAWATFQGWLKRNRKWAEERNGKNEQHGTVRQSTIGGRAVDPALAKYS
jgi:hypothetical protein